MSMIPMRQIIGQWQWNHPVDPVEFVFNSCLGVHFVLRCQDENHILREVWSFPGIGSSFKAPRLHWGIRPVKTSRLVPGFWRLPNWMAFMSQIESYIEMLILFSCWPALTSRFSQRFFNGTRQMSLTIPEEAKPGASAVFPHWFGLSQCSACSESCLLKFFPEEPRVWFSRLPAISCHSS